MASKRERKRRILKEKKMENEYIVDRDLLAKFRDNALWKLFTMSGLSIKAFAKFWNLDRSQISRILEKRRNFELEKKGGKK